MTQNDLDRALATWLDDAAPSEAPDGLMAAVDDGLAGRRPKARWRALLTERSMRSSGRVVVGSPTVRAAYVLGLVALFAAIGAAAIVIGSQFLPRPPTPLIPPNGVIAYDTQTAIYVARPDGSGPQLIVDGLGDAASASWSPDGSRLAFWAEGSPDALYVADADGSNRVRLTGDLWIATNSPPVWSPTGQQLLFSTESGPDRLDERLYVVNVDGSGLTQLGADHPEDPMQRVLPAWSPDGLWISFKGIPASLRADESQLFLVRSDGTGEHRLTTPDRFFFEPGPRWEPTVTNPRLVFAGGEVRAGGDVYLYDIGSDEASVLSADPANELAPTWSPDGRRLAWFVTDDFDRAVAIKVVNVDGGAVLTVQTAGIAGPPLWLAFSPDGTRLYGSNADKTAVIVITIDASQPPVVIRHAIGQGMPAWQRLTP